MTVAMPMHINLRPSHNICHNGWELI